MLGWPSASQTAGPTRSGGATIVADQIRFSVAGVERREIAHDSQ